MPAGIEAHGHIRFLTDIHLKTPNLYSESHQSEEFKAGLALLRSEKPAALLTEPFLFEGSLMTAGENPVELRRLAYVLSVLGNVPTVGGILIRPNEEQALATGGFSSEPWYTPSPHFQRALKGKILALLYPKDLDWNQARWSHRKPFKVLAVDSTYRLGLIRAEDWMRVLPLAEAAERDSVHFNLLADQSYPGAAPYGNKAKHFNRLADQSYGEAPPYGNKAKQIPRSEYHVLLDSLGLNAEAYELSLWVDARQSNSVNGVLFVEEVNEQGQGQWIAQANPARSRCLDGGWARCSLTFVARPNMRYRIALTAYDFQSKAFGVNRFMLRPLDIDVGVYLERTACGTTIGRKYHESATGGLRIGMEARLVFGGKEKGGEDKCGAVGIAGGKVGQGETAGQALVREFQEELGMELKVGRVLGSVEQAGAANLRLIALEASCALDWPSHSSDHDSVVWVAPEFWRLLNWCGNDARLLQQILGAFSRG